VTNFFMLLFTEGRLHISVYYLIYFCILHCMGVYLRLFSIERPISIF
jgi:hypothetical protein